MNEILSRVIAVFFNPKPVGKDAVVHEFFERFHNQTSILPETLNVVTHLFPFGFIVTPI